MFYWPYKQWSKQLNLKWNILAGKQYYFMVYIVIHHIRIGENQKPV